MKLEKPLKPHDFMLFSEVRIEYSRYFSKLGMILSSYIVLAVNNSKIRALDCFLPETRKN